MRPLVSISIAGLGAVLVTALLAFFFATPAGQTCTTPDNPLTTQVEVWHAPLVCNG